MKARRTGIVVALSLIVTLGLGETLAAQGAVGTPAGWEAVRRQVEAQGGSWAEAEARLRSSGVMVDGTPAPQSANDPAWSRVMRALGPTAPSTQNNRTQVAIDTAMNNLSPDPAFSPPIDSLPIFGAALTRGGWDSERLATTWPTDDSYQVGPGDEIALVLSGEIDLAHTLVVTREGQIFVPRVGMLAAGGRPMRDLRSDMLRRLQRTYGDVRVGESGPTTMALTLTRPRTIAVVVSGAVRQPGLVTIPGTAQVLHALLAAGGVSEQGSLRDISIVRPGYGVVATWDAYDLLLHGKADHPALQAGDVIRVPSRTALVSIVGGVNQPIRVEVRPGEPLAQILLAAGGTTPAAEKGTATRIGRGANGFITTTWSREEWDRAPLQPGDSVTIAEAEAQRSLAPTIQIGGAVWAPGVVAWQAGLRASEALQRANGLRPDALGDRILIYRRGPDGREEQMRMAWDETQQRPAPDHVLHPQDRIEVFSADALTPNTVVRVDGAVVKPSEFPFRTGMTVRDVVLMAGGMLPSAWGDSIEVTRDRRGESPDLLGVPERIPFALLRPGDNIKSDPRTEVPLGPGDHITVLTAPYWAPSAAVTLQGAVVSAGTFALTRRSERLSDLLGRAGGLRPEAYSAGMRLRRVGVGDINLDLPKALRDPSHRDNIVLVDGDTITIPTYSPVVLVRGEVQQPTAVAYTPGRDLDYYIRAAGGLTAIADNSRTFVQQANGTIQASRVRRILGDTRPVPLPGSVVIVPVRPERPQTNWGSIFGGIASILGSVVTIVAISR